MMRGFTLVELMVALAVFGLIAASGVALLGQGVTTQERVRDHAGQILALERTRAQLRADIAQAVPRPTRDPAGLVRPAFSGGMDGSGQPLLALVRRGWENPDGARRASMQYVTYALDGDRLERRTAAMLDGTPADNSSLVIDGVQALSQRFLSKGEWRRDWRPEAVDALPDAVEIEMAIDGVGPIRLLFATSDIQPAATPGDGADADVQS